MCLTVPYFRVPRFVRVWDDDDEALQPEWEIDPKDLQVLEKVRLPVANAGLATIIREQGASVILNPCKHIHSMA